MLVEKAIPANPTGSRALQQHLFSLLQSCNSIRKLAQIHTQIVINGFSQKSYILVKLLSFYAVSGYLQNVSNLIQNIENPSTTVWNQIIRGHARSSTPHKSVEFFNRMVETEVEPDEFTYSFLISACARCGLLREGEQVHGRVLVNGYCSNMFVQTNLINLYAMAGVDSSIIYARRVFDEMGQRNVVSWNSLLAVSQKLTAELHPDQAAGYLVLLSHVFADAKKWLDVAAVRHKMVEMGVRKPPGRSWVQINGVIHDFVAGDSTHKHAPMIYKMLGVITWQTQCEGYKPEKSYALSYVED
ncbi:hypothetical protein FEM48_Zijuj05G0140800 [Ziziphus jujuba var. spinosa]|uniref:Pentatricopeptide repeat-containing protein n=1 Tax=Ziziphus jujuba var. spinosa TaxID=714518 RepID=A0A978VF96_ZIZJJ|nr:hypothetical protein FEM48_Zijuj05G0140800 [Ziziphus jujuba var. spinosa]